MIKKIIATLLIVADVLVVSSQSLSAFSIPDSISKNAEAVIRYDVMDIVINNQKNMSIVNKTAITIFNKAADELANLTLHYDKYDKIVSVNMNYYDSFGNPIKKVKRSDFKDFAAVDGGTLYSDSRVIHYNYTPISYPYTVVYEYEKSSNNTAFIPTWYPISGYNLGVISSKFSLKASADLKVQKLEKNLAEFNVVSEKLPQQWNFSLSNISPIKEEEMSPSFLELMPSLKFAVNKFHIAGVDGEAETWEDFGNWMQNNLLATRNNLSEETKTKIKELVNGVNDPKEKAKLIYEYVQNKTRYISVQIGVGGWMPMYTDDVDRLAYGDCKALTFYTKSLLEAAGVPAYYSAVYAGDDDNRNIEKELVSMQGNHVFLILPMEKDSIFLECTSQKIPFGIKDSFTADRDVLCLTPQGGKIIRTPAYKPEENFQENRHSYSIDAKGNIIAQVEIKSYGNQYGEHIQYFDGKTPRELDEAFKDYFQYVNNITFNNLTAKNNREEKRFEESISFNATDYAVINTDGSMIFSPNAFNRSSYIPQKEANRETPFVVNRGFKDDDLYTIQIPDEYIIEELPKPVSIENEFGKYSCSIEKSSENTLTYKRNITIYNKQFPKELYENYRKFKKDLKKHDEVKILLKKK